VFPALATARVSTLYALKTNRSVFYKNDSDQSEKRNLSVNLRTDQWNFLQSQADSQGVSRNQALRDILDQVMEDE
jgi:hypothetical protein